MIQTPLDRALIDIRRGVPVIVVDSFDRENEGDFMIAAEMATEETLAFLALEGRGIMCIPTERSILERLCIPMSPSNNTDRFVTPFTVSVDARYNISTGVSVLDRLETIRVMLDESSTEHDLTYPGHMFPLRPREGGLLERQGHTEASIELCRLAGVKPVAIIIEIMNVDGSMSTLSDLTKIADKHNLVIISIESILETITELIDSNIEA